MKTVRLEDLGLTAKQIEAVRQEARQRGPAFGASLALQLAPRMRYRWGARIMERSGADLIADCQRLADRWPW